ncbi:MAG: 16S rRNA (uracil(1498)-N(3))-methyltransferase [Candidatus Omnitrophica bacterium]|nr:16S rRNA (uracil(1498)-N(3))-methyltransferase [Candidatus Omnitrophota bacterium]
MHRFFAHSKNISANNISISDKAEAHHLKGVLRIKLKEKLAVFDDKGNEYLCSVLSLSGAVVLGIEKRVPAGALAYKSKLTIACAIPKNSKMDDIVDKLTQLGVDTIIPLLTERVIVKLNKEKKGQRRKRWERIAFSAAKQSQRFNLPVIAPIEEMRGALSRSKGHDLKIILTLAESQRKTLREAFEGNKPTKIYVLIGPEGDFTDQEIALAKKEGFAPLTLGDLVLRVETAAVAAASFIRLYLYENR